jgi:SOS regulatory protein LexA
VPPAGQSHESFEWGTSLENALSAFNHRDARVASYELLKALDDSAQMASLCQYEIMRLSPEIIPDSILEDWYEFLTKLYEYMPNVFTDNADLIAPDDSGNLERIFDDIGNAALEALMAVKYMDRKGSPEEGRLGAVKKLHKLRTELHAGKLKVEQLSRVSELAAVSEENGSSEVVQVQLLGHIAAGQPIIAIESPEESLPLPRQLIGEGVLFMVKVNGNSMVNAGIFNGDLVVIRQQPTAEDGEMVAARLEDEVTIKTFERSGGHVWLVPKSPEHEKILGDDAVILGKVVAMLRRV